MKLTPLTLILTALVAAPVAAAEDPDAGDLRELREELRQTQRQLLDLTRRIEQLSREEGPLRAPLSFDLMGSERPMVGIVMNATRDRNGVRLAGVTPGGPADKAGLRSGDVILEINGQSLAGAAAVERAYQLLENMAVGDVFQFGYERNGERHTTSVTAELHQPAGTYGYRFRIPDIQLGEDSRFGLELDQFKDFADRYRNWQLNLEELPGGAYLWRFGFDWSGLELAPLNVELGRYFGADQGVLVISSELEDDQLRGGDVIVAIDGKQVETPKEAMRLLGRFKAGEQIPLQIVRERAPLEVALTAPDSSGATGNFFFQGDSVD